MASHPRTMSRLWRSGWQTWTFSWTRSGRRWETRKLWRSSWNSARWPTLRTLPWQQPHWIQWNDSQINLYPAPADQALVNDIHTIQPSVNGINEVGLYLKKEAEPPFAVYIQKLLDELNGQWENVCKQVRAQQLFEVGAERSFHAVWTRRSWDVQLLCHWSCAIRRHWPKEFTPDCIVHFICSIQIQQTQNTAIYFYDSAVIYRRSAAV